MELEKLNMKADLIGRYRAHTCTHLYAFGYVKKGIVYGSIVQDDGALLERLTYAERRSDGWRLCYRPNLEQIALIESLSLLTYELTTLEQFESLFRARDDMNRGNIFEWLTCEHFGTERLPDKNFSVLPDCYIKGMPVQAKFGARSGASTFVRAETLDNLGF